VRRQLDRARRIREAKPPEEDPDRHEHGEHDHVSFEHQDSFLSPAGLVERLHRREQAQAREITAVEVSTVR
jgi:hypothetical protein